MKYSLAVMLACAGLLAHADNRPYLCEIGLQGGAGYYVGDATPHIFSDVRETYGAHFRYKFTDRWALQAKGMTQRITGNTTQWQYRKATDTVMWTNRMINIDVMAECNFFHYGNKDPYNANIKPYTPYIFLGVGAAVYGGWDEKTGELKPFCKVAAYIPFGIGFKWKIHERMGMFIAWQHNLYIADNLEYVLPKDTEKGVGPLNNSYELNGSNILNCDLTGQLTVGLVLELGRAKKICPFCEMNKDYYGL